MAILGFHFSGVYRNQLLKGFKQATIMNGEHYFKIGQEVQVYLSDKSNLFDGITEKRVGKAIIKGFKVMTVSDLVGSNAVLCGYENLNQLKNDLIKWYGSNEGSVITFVKFNFHKL